ncbi:hypothetical protein C9J85_19600 [Haloferax sp. wsp5]|nr:hypothetical protein C9J85_19600 [Haloferax sp. wsp5]
MSPTPLVGAWYTPLLVVPAILVGLLPVGFVFLLTFAFVEQEIAVRDATVTTAFVSVGQAGTASTGRLAVRITFIDFATSRIHGDVTTRRPHPRSRYSASPASMCLQRVLDTVHIRWMDAFFPRFQRGGQSHPREAVRVRARDVRFRVVRPDTEIRAFDGEVTSLCQLLHVLLSLLSIGDVLEIPRAPTTSPSSNSGSPQSVPT